MPLLYLSPLLRCSVIYSWNKLSELKVRIPTPPFFSCFQGFFFTLVLYPVCLFLILQALKSLFSSSISLFLSIWDGNCLSAGQTRTLGCLCIYSIWAKKKCIWWISFVNGVAAIRLSFFVNDFYSLSEMFVRICQINIDACASVRKMIGILNCWRC